MKKVYFKTFGCKVNQYESEFLRSGLGQRGYDTTDDFTKADWCVINSCTVTGESDTKCRHFVRKILKENDHCRMVVTGCYAQRSAADITLLSPRVAVVGQQQKNDIIALIAGNAAGRAEDPSLKSFHNHSRAFVKVQDGCDAFCSYCIVPHVRAVDSWKDIRPVIHDLCKEDTIALKEKRIEDGMRYLAAIKASSIDLSWSDYRSKKRNPATEKELDVLYTSLAGSLK